MVRTWSSHGFGSSRPEWGERVGSMDQHAAVPFRELSADIFGVSGAWRNTAGALMTLWRKGHA